MNQNPLVSIILCTYNGGKYIEEQLLSIIKQTYNNLEILIVDDISSDNTVEIVKRIQSTDDRIKLIVNEKNLGYNKNFEKALGLAAGEYLAIADQDDVWLPEKITKLMSLWNNPSTLMVACNSARFDEMNKPKTHYLKLKNTFKGNDARCFFLENQISGHNMIIKKKLLTLAAPFPEKFFYDWWLVIVACCNGNVNTTEDVLVYQRVHANNSSATPKGLFFFDTVLERLPIMLKAPNMPAAYKTFGENLLEKFSVLKEKTFSFKLFWFILLHSRILFFYKKKSFPYFSYFKHSLKLASSKKIA